MHLKIIDECSWLHRKISFVYQIGVYGLVILILAFPFLVIFSDSNLPSSMFLLYTISYGILLSGIEIINIIIQEKWGRNTKSLILKHFSNCPDNEHHSIIIAHKTDLDGEGNFPISDYYDGVDVLINYFISNKPPIPFKVTEITIKEEAIDLICDPHAQFLWVFGHGQRNKLALQDNFLCYKEITTPLNKKFVGQYHCNSPWGTSLADITHALESDVTIFPRYPIFTRYAIKRKLTELKGKKII
ncbi:MAG: hypothetical protein NTY71_06520 [Methanoregula sp.]|nr:hypothetical protein [Methanoregula sp.]